MNNIHKSWKPLFKKYDINLDELYNNTNIIYPPKEQVFRVFEKDINDISIVLLGQDPYHGKGQANGLSFSVNKTQKIPPSLKNIFKELNLEFPERNYKFEHGDLEKWFDQNNIFLLNSSLTVEESNAGSHMQIWEEFTNDVIKFISKKNNNAVFLLLGNYAKNKDVFIEDKSKIIYGIHPSPLARGFIGSNVFKKVEEILEKEIDWQN